MFYECPLCSRLFYVCTKGIASRLEDDDHMGFYYVYYCLLILTCRNGMHLILQCKFLLRKEKHIIDTLKENYRDEILGKQTEGK